jgi:aminopeptidase
MSLKEFEKFIFSATLLDWKKLSKKMKKIADFLDKSDKIKVIGKETDLTFSIKGKKAIPADGENNMPDGEIFTAINEKTANGTVYFDYPLRVFGKRIKNIKLWFKDGKVVKFNCSDNKSFNKLIDTDKGGRYIGEFAMGFNPKINRFSDALLFDEKIFKTIHFALGNAYPECKGKNKSAIHEDIVKDMKKGKIFADGKLIYKDGKFLI